jgi:diguanylate cyclase (GGDEF)-like protein/PAS domain S-box-containing protein
MNYLGPLTQLLLRLTTVSLLVATVLIYSYYAVALGQEKNSLINLAQSQAQILDSLAHNLQDSTTVEKIIQNTAPTLSSFDNTGELVIAKREGQQIRFLLRRSHKREDIPPVIPADNPGAQPMQMAIQGEQGVRLGLDYRRVKVLAAYAPVVHLGWGIVAKIDLQEFRTPFYQLGLGSLGATALLNVLAWRWYVNASDSLRRQLDDNIAQNQKSTAELTETNSQLSQQVIEKQRLEAILRREIDLLARVMETSPVGIVMVDPNGVVLIASERAQIILRLQEQNYPLQLHSHAECQIIDEQGEVLEDSLLPFEQVVRTQQSVYDCRQLMSFPNGDRVILSVNAAPLFNMEEELEGVVLAVEDITERLQIEAALLHSEAQFRGIFEQAAVGIAIVSLGGEFIRVNQHYCHLLGYSENELLQKTCQEITHPEDWDNHQEIWQQSWQRETQTFSVEKRYLQQNQSFIWVNLSGSVVRDSNDMPIYLITIIENIHYRKEALQALRQSEEGFRRIVETANEGIWMIDGNNLTTFVNPRMAEMLGYTVEEMMGRSLLEFMDTEGQKLALEKLEHRRQGRREQHDFCFTRQDGSFIWVMISTNPILDDHGNYIGALGMITDISERRSAEQNLQNINTELTTWVKELEQRNQDSSILDNINDFLQLCQTSDEAYHLLGELLEPLFPDCNGAIFMFDSDTNLLEIVSNWGDSSYSKSLFAVDECWSIRRGEMHFVEHKNSRLFCSHVQHSEDLAQSLCLPMVAQGKAIGLLYINTKKLESLSEVKKQLAATVSKNLSLGLANIKLRENLKTQSIRDPLTNLYNRRYMEESLSREISLAQRRIHTVGIIMLDVDNFRNFNNRYGHNVGDIALKIVGQFLSAHTRAGDIACRYGGEEFILILPEASLENAVRRAEEVREGVRLMGLNHGHSALSTLTISLGVSCFPDHGITPEILLGAADQALRQAKAEGKNCVRVYAQS